MGLWRCNWGGADHALRWYFLWVNYFFAQQSFRLLCRDFIHLDGWFLPINGIDPWCFVIPELCLSQSKRSNLGLAALILTKLPNPAIIFGLRILFLLIDHFHISFGVLLVLEIDRLVFLMILNLLGIRSDHVFRKSCLAQMWDGGFRLKDAAIYLTKAKIFWSWDNFWLGIRHLGTIFRSNLVCCR